MTSINNQELFYNHALSGYVPIERRVYYQKIFDIYLKGYESYKVTTEEESKNKQIHFFALLNFEILRAYHHLQQRKLEESMEIKKEKDPWAISFLDESNFKKAEGEYWSCRRARCRNLGKFLNNSFRIITQNIRCFSCFQKLDFSSDLFGDTITKRDENLRKLFDCVLYAKLNLKEIYSGLNIPKEEIIWIYDNESPYEYLDKYGTLVRGLYHYFISKGVVEPIAPKNQLPDNVYSDLVLGLERIKFNPSAYAVKG